MGFWQFVSENPIPVLVFLWFVWCLYERLLTSLDEWNRRLADVEKHAAKLEAESKFHPQTIEDLDGKRRADRARNRGNAD